MIPDACAYIVERMFGKLIKYLTTLFINRVILTCRFANTSTIFLMRGFRKEYSWSLSGVQLTRCMVMISL